MFFSLACEVKKTLIQQEITEQDLLGYWKTLKGNAEQIMFDIDESEYYFRSYLHQRPFEIGTWSLDNNKLIIAIDNGDTIVYNKITLINNILNLFTTENREERYKKIK